MKNIREFEPDHYDRPRRNVLVEDYAYGGLVKVNRILFCLIFLLLAIIFTVGFSLLTPNKLLTQFTSNQLIAKKAEMGTNPAFSNDLNDLKSQIVGLISGSIESKLQVLELSIKSGSVNHVDLTTLGDLHNDISILRRFSKIKQAPLFTSEQDALTQLYAVEQLMHEITQLKMLIYITIISCGLMLVAVAGAWLQQRYLLSYEKQGNYLPKSAK